MFSNTSIYITSYNQPIKLIVGLGNIGTKYNITRHNIGFSFIDYLLHHFLEKYSSNITKLEKEEYETYTIELLNLVILKPKLMMNLSGKALLRYLKNRNYSLDEMLVVHDDLDVKFGKYKIHFKKSPKSHNGVSSIERELKSQEFYRLRIGIENRENYYIPGIDYVLQKFTADEKDRLSDIFFRICEKEFSFMDDLSE